MNRDFLNIDKKLQPIFSLSFAIKESTATESSAVSNGTSVSAPSRRYGKTHWRHMGGGKHFKGIRFTNDIVT